MNLFFFAAGQKVKKCCRRFLHLLEHWATQKLLLCGAGAGGGGSG
jgi:hypothetical protein